MRGMRCPLLGSRKMAIAWIVCFVFPMAFISGATLYWLPLALLAELILPHSAWAYRLVRIATYPAGAAFAFPVCAFAWPRPAPREPLPGRH